MMTDSDRTENLLRLPNRATSARRVPSPPDLCSAETLAHRLDCSLSTVHAYVRRGLLPKPLKLGELVRWRWADVERLTDELANGRDSRGTTADPYLAGIQRGTTEETGD